MYEVDDRVPTRRTVQSVAVKTFPWVRPRREGVAGEPGTSVPSKDQVEPNQALPSPVVKLEDDMRITTAKDGTQMVDWKVSKKWITGTLEGITVTSYIKRWDVSLGPPFDVGRTYTSIEGSQFIVTALSDAWEDE